MYHSVQQRVIGWVVGYLADFADVDLEDVSSSLISGFCALRNMRLRTRTLNKFLPPGVPFEMIGGTAELVEISIPWLSLSANPVSVRVEGVKLTVTGSLGACDNECTEERKKEMEDKLADIIREELTEKRLFGPLWELHSQTAMANDEAALTKRSGSEGDGSKSGGRKGGDNEKEEEGEDDKKVSIGDTGEDDDDDEFHSCLDEEELLSEKTEEEEESTSTDGSEQSAAARTGITGSALGMLGNLSRRFLPEALTTARSVSLTLKNVSVTLLSGEEHVCGSVDEISVSLIRDATLPRKHSLKVSGATIFLEKNGEASNTIVPKQSCDVVVTEVKNHINIDTIVGTVSLELSKPNAVCLVRCAGSIMHDFTAVPPFARHLLPLKYAKQHWKYACSAVLCLIRDRRKRWNFLEEHVGEFCEMRKRYLALLRKLHANPGQFLLYKDQLAMYESIIRYRDVVEAYRILVQKEAIAKITQQQHAKDDNNHLSPAPEMPTSVASSFTGLSSQQRPITSVELFPGLKKTVSVHVKVDSVFMALPTSSTVMMDTINLTAEVTADGLTCEVACGGVQGYQQLGHSDNSEKLFGVGGAKPLSITASTLSPFAQSMARRSGSQSSFSQSTRRGPPSLSVAVSVGDVAAHFSSSAISSIIVDATRLVQYAQAHLPPGTKHKPQQLLARNTAVKEPAKIPISHVTLEATSLCIDVENTLFFRMDPSTVAVDIPRSVVQPLLHGISMTHKIAHKEDTVDDDKSVLLSVLEPFSIECDMTKERFPIVATSDVKMAVYSETIEFLQNFGCGIAGKVGEGMNAAPLSSRTVAKEQQQQQQEEEEEERKEETEKGKRKESRGLSLDSIASSASTAESSKSGAFPPPKLVLLSKQSPLFAEECAVSPFSAADVERIAFDQPIVFSKIICDVVSPLPAVTAFVSNLEITKMQPLHPSVTVGKSICMTWEKHEISVLGGQIEMWGQGNKEAQTTCMFALVPSLVAASKTVIHIVMPCCGIGLRRAEAHSLDAIPPSQQMLFNGVEMKVCQRDIDLKIPQISIFDGGATASVFCEVLPSPSEKTEFVPFIGGFANMKFSLCEVNIKRIMATDMVAVSDAGNLMPLMLAAVPLKVKHFFLSSLTNINLDLATSSQASPKQAEITFVNGEQRFLGVHFEACDEATDLSDPAKWVKSSKFTPAGSPPRRPRRGSTDKAFYSLRTENAHRKWKGLVVRYNIENMEMFILQTPFMFNLTASPEIDFGVSLNRIVFRFPIPRRTHWLPDLPYLNRGATLFVEDASLCVSSKKDDQIISVLDSRVSQLHFEQLSVVGGCDTIFVAEVVHTVDLSNAVAIRDLILAAETLAVVADPRERMIIFEKYELDEIATIDATKKLLWVKAANNCSQSVVVLENKEIRFDPSLLPALIVDDTVTVCLRNCRFVTEKETVTPSQRCALIQTVGTGTFVLDGMTLPSSVPSGSIDSISVSRKSAKIPVVRPLIFAVENTEWNVKLGCNTALLFGMTDTKFQASIDNNLLSVSFESTLQKLLSIHSKAGAMRPVMKSARATVEARVLMQPCEEGIVSVLFVDVVVGFYAEPLFVSTQFISDFSVCAEAISRRVQEAQAARRKKLLDPVPSHKKALKTERLFTELTKFTAKVNCPVASLTLELPSGIPLVRATMFDAKIGVETVGDATDVYSGDIGAIRGSANATFSLSVFVPYAGIWRDLIPKSVHYTSVLVSSLMKVTVKSTVQKSKVELYQDAIQVLAYSVPAIKNATATALVMVNHSGLPIGLRGNWGVFSVPIDATLSKQGRGNVFSFPCEVKVGGFDWMKLKPVALSLIERQKRAPHALLFGTEAIVKAAPTVSVYVTITQAEDLAVCVTVSSMLAVKNLLPVPLTLRGESAAALEPILGPSMEITIKSGEESCVPMWLMDDDFFSFSVGPSNSYEIGCSPRALAQKAAEEPSLHSVQQEFTIANVRGAMKYVVVSAMQSTHLSRGVIVFRPSCPSIINRTGFGLSVTLYDLSSPVQNTKWIKNDESWSSLRYSIESEVRYEVELTMVGGVKSASRRIPFHPATEQAEEQVQLYYEDNSPSLKLKPRLETDSFGNTSLIFEALGLLFKNDTGVPIYVMQEDGTEIEGLGPNVVPFSGERSFLVPTAQNILLKSTTSFPSRPIYIASSFVGESLIECPLLAGQGPLAEGFVISSKSQSEFEVLPFFILVNETGRWLHVFHSSESTDKGLRFTVAQSSSKSHAFVAPKGDVFRFAVGDEQDKEPSSSQLSDPLHITKVFAGTGRRHAVLRLGSNSHDVIISRESVTTPIVVTVLAPRAPLIALFNCSDVEFDLVGPFRSTSLTPLAHMDTSIQLRNGRQIVEINIDEDCVQRIHRLNLDYIVERKITQCGFVIRVLLCRNLPGRGDVPLSAFAAAIPSGFDIRAQFRVAAATCQIMKPSDGKPMCTAGFEEFTAVANGDRDSNVLECHLNAFSIIDHSNEETPLLSSMSLELLALNARASFDGEGKLHGVSFKSIRFGVTPIEFSTRDEFASSMVQFGKLCLPPKKLPKPIIAVSVRAPDFCPSPTFSGLSLPSQASSSSLMSLQAAGNTEKTRATSPNVGVKIGNFEITPIKFVLSWQRGGDIETDLLRDFFLSWVVGTVHRAHILLESFSTSNVDVASPSELLIRVSKFYLSSLKQQWQTVLLGCTLGGPMAILNSLVNESPTTSIPLLWKSVSGAPSALFSGLFGSGKQAPPARTESSSSLQHSEASVAIPQNWICDECKSVISLVEDGATPAEVVLRFGLVALSHHGSYKEIESCIDAIPLSPKHTVMALPLLRDRLGRWKPTGGKGNVKEMSGDAAASVLSAATVAYLLMVDSTCVTDHWCRTFFAAVGKLKQPSQEKLPLQLERGASLGSREHSVSSLKKASGGNNLDDLS